MKLKNGVRICSIRGCRESHYAKDFCMHHYNVSEPVREKEKARRKTPEGKEKEHKKNKKYNRSFKGMIKSKMRHAGLPESERPKVEEAFKTFNLKCHCCGTNKPGGRGSWNLDHKGKRFRGIVCLYCNVAAGMLNDSIKRCEMLISYLKRTSV
jgi:hypothetical protein